MAASRSTSSVLKAFFKTDFGVALLITLVWKILLTTIGYIIDIQNGGATSLFDHTMRWDAGWYLTVVSDHYATNHAAAAFYPLFPFLVGSLHFISFGLLDYSVAGQLINTFAVWLALAGLIKLGRVVASEKRRFWIAALVLSAPAAFFLHVFYSEAVFLALSVWAYYLALQRRWLGVGLLLGILTATRLPSVLIVALCGLEFLRAYEWKIKKALNRNLFYFLIAPIGFLAYSLYLYVTTRDPLGMFHAYQATTDWIYQVFNPNIFETVAKAGYQVIRVIGGLRPFDGEFVVNILLPLAGLGLLLLASLYLILRRKKEYVPVGIVGLLSFVMFTLNSNVVSVHRYVLPCIGIYIALVLLATTRRRQWLLWAGCIIAIAVQLWLYGRFINLMFAG